jgi:hypothetical protein
VRYGAASLPRKANSVTVRPSTVAVLPNSSGIRAAVIPQQKTKRPGLGLSHKALSRSALPQVLLNHRLAPQQFRVNGTEVPDDITLRPYRDGSRRLNLYPLAAGQFRER